MKDRTETIWSEYRFTEEEARQNAKDLAQKLQDAEGLENQLVSIKSDFKAKIDLAKAEIVTLRNRVSFGTEQRQFRCHVKLDTASKTRIYFDANTGELITTKPFQPEDYQTAMELEE